MDTNQLKKAIKNGRIEWQKHSLERMMERGITREEVKRVLLEGELIENYREDKPFESGLFLGWIDGKPLHTVASIDSRSDCCFIITVYKPDLKHFEQDYRTRKK